LPNNQTNNGDFCSKQGKRQISVDTVPNGEAICEAYRGEEVLYRLEHDLYHNKDARTAAWARIATEVDGGFSGKRSILTRFNCSTKFAEYHQL